MRERAYCHGDDQFAHNCGLLNHLNSFHGRILKLNAKFDADFLLYWLSHF